MAPHVVNRCQREDRWVTISVSNEYVYRELLGVGGPQYAKLENASHIGMDYATKQE